MAKKSIVPPSDLERLMEEADISGPAAARLRAANTPERPAGRRGHGASEPAAPKQSVPPF